MPGAGGLEVCQALRAGEAPTASRYIALTTEERGSPEVSWALEAGADDVLPTPPEPARLRATLQAGRRIVELQAVLEERERLRHALVQARSICHDLHQPLQVARGWADLLLVDAPPGYPDRAALESIASSVDMAAELARRFQALARAHTQVNGPTPLSPPQAHAAAH
jgi:CheY-like chemotaxis protein